MTEIDDIAEATIAETEKQIKDGRVAAATTEHDQEEVRLEVLRHSWGRYIGQVEDDESIPEDEKLSKAEERFRKWLMKYKPGTWPTLRSENFIERMKRIHPGASSLGREDDIVRMLNDHYAEVREANAAARAAKENHQRALHELLSETIRQYGSQRMDATSAPLHTTVSRASTAGAVSGSAGKDVPTFSNLPSEDFKNWLRLLDMAKEQHGWEDLPTIRLAMSKLRGSAATFNDYFEQAGKARLVVTWESFKTELKEKFLSRQRVVDLSCALGDLSQKSDEKVSEFLMRVWKTVGDYMEATAAARGDDPYSRLGPDMQLGFRKIEVYRRFMSGLRSGNK